MARPETLIPGNCYFSEHFYDNDLVLPMIDTLVYVGQETDQDEGRLWLFKRAGEPAQPRRAGSIVGTAGLDWVLRSPVA